MSTEIDDLKELQKLAASLIANIKRRDKISGKSYADMTQKQVQKNGADLSWIGMDMDKLRRELHAVAVNCGIAEPRSEYDDVDYRPSAFHHYRYKQRLPRCRQQ